MERKIHFKKLSLQENSIKCWFLERKKRKKIIMINKTKVIITLRDMPLSRHFGS